MSRKSAPLQPTFDDYLAEIALQDSLHLVEVHANPEWREVAYQCVVAVAKRLEEFTTDQVIAELAQYPVTTHEGRALGPVMVRAARENIIAATSRFEKSAAVSRHHTKKQIWRSLIVNNLQNNKGASWRTQSSSMEMS
jgi:hypothetical protein